MAGLGGYKHSTARVSQAAEPFFVVSRPGANVRSGSRDLQWLLC